MKSILSDAAVGVDDDLLRFDRYTNPLIKLFTDEQTETPFTVGIFGSWGSGKSTLLRMLNERLAREYDGQFVLVNFNAWLHRGEKNMLLPLLHTLHDTLLESRWARFTESAQRISTVLLRLGADVLLKSMTADAASLEKIEQLEDAYLKERGRVTSELRTLHETLQKEADRIHAGKARLIFFIDDLDRCQPDEIISLLEAIKLFLDLRHTFVVLAVDKEVIDSGIQIRYDKFDFIKSRKLSLGSEYLEKMVQLPLHLYPPTSDQLRDFIDRSDPIDEVRAQLQVLNDIVLPNPRKIKRVLNILSITHQIAQSTKGLAALDPALLTRLTVLRVQNGELFTEVANQPQLLVALEGLYADPPRFRIDSPSDWAVFGSARETIKDVCQRFYQPTTYIARLFKGAGFAGKPDAELQRYISMVGT